MKTGTKNELITWLLTQDETKKFEIKEFKEKRSLNANSYYWKLISEISKINHSSIEEIHFEQLKKYGVMDYISLKSEIAPNNYFKYYVEDKHFKMGKQEMSSYKVYKESHLMDSKEFSYLLEQTIDEAREMGIEILEDKQIEEMIKNYDKMH